MSTRIRLRRMGSNKRPFYRVVVADQRSARDGRFIEIIGKYHPLSDPSVIEIDEARAMHWLMVGAQPSDQVRNLMSKVGIWERFVAERPNAAIATTPRGERPARPKLSKKAQAKAQESEQRQKEPAAETPPVPAAEPSGEVEAEAEAEVPTPGTEAAPTPETEAPAPEPDSATDDGSGSEALSAEEPSGA